MTVQPATTLRNVTTSCAWNIHPFECFVLDCVIVSMPPTGMWLKPLQEAWAYTSNFDPDNGAYKGSVCFNQPLHWLVGMTMIDILFRISTAWLFHNEWNTGFMNITLSESTGWAYWFSQLSNTVAKGRKKRSLTRWRICSNIIGSCTYVFAMVRRETVWWCIHQSREIAWWLRESDAPQHCIISTQFSVRCESRAIRR